MTSDARLTRGTLFAHRARVRRLLSSVEQSEDVAQTVEEKLLRTDRDPAPGYIAAMLRSAAIDTQRAENTRRRYEGEFAQHAERLDTRSPERSIAAKQTLDALVAALDELSPANREIFVRACVEEQPRGEIARALGLPLSTVEKRLAKARAHCLKRIGPLMDGD
ncbi:MAG: sigma-70 family RNA polymerase sigma factor [Pseudomonadota bacterium]